MYGEQYWFASRNDPGYNFAIRLKNSYYNISGWALLGVDGFGNESSWSREEGFRPVFFINSGVKILSGSGTKGDPYELGL